MGYWGVKSHENDDAGNLLDAAFDRVHTTRYEQLMDDSNPLSFEQVQARLANLNTLAAALGILAEEHGPDSDLWPPEARLACAGVVVRHVELGVLPDADTLTRAIAFLQSESVDWDPPDLPARERARTRELALLELKRTR